MRVRSGYSFKTAFGHLPDVAKRIEEIGWKHYPISDRNSTFAFNRWTKLVPKPIYGIELAVTASIGEKNNSIDWWTFFAKKEIKDINALYSLATHQASRGPELTYGQALEAKGVIKIAGEFVLLDRIKPQKDLYVALSPGMPIAMYREAKKRKFKFIATSDNYYPREADKEAYRVALYRRSQTQTYPLYLLDDKEWSDACWFADDKTKKEATRNRDAAFGQCSAKMEKAQLIQPEKKKTLHAMCVDGAKRLGVNLKDPIYKERLERELRLIGEKKFEDYFYIIADLIDWSKERMMIGPARGSSCGSLVCYLLGITTVDPIEFNLIFERFIDVNRNDLPDIDIDFSDDLRALSFKYAEEKYGEERTARLGTVGVFRPRSALGQAGKSLAIPKWRIDKVVDALIVRSSGDSRALQTLEDTLRETGPGAEFLIDFPESVIAAKMEGHPSMSSQHAAGLIITEKDIDTFVAVDTRSKVAMCDKKDAEDLGMLKIDMLGLTQLSIFERTLELIGLLEKRQSKLDDTPVRLKDGRRIVDFFTALPLDDPKAFQILNDRKFSGIFQFNGPALQSLARSIKTEHIEDIISMTALARPGPMASGGTQRWVERKSGAEITYPHELFKPYIEQTLGVVTYQEQVMQIGREVGDLSWDDVTQLRKAMSRSLGKEFFDRYGDRWKTAAIRKGVPVDVAETTWDELCAYGSWAFNRSHAVAYGLVSYWCCYLKAYHPSEFGAATLDAEVNPVKQLMVLRELKKEGVDYVPVDLEHSTDKWSIRPEDGTLVGPLTAIVGIGSATAKEVMARRAEGKPLRPAVAKRLSSMKTDIDSLYPVQDAIAAQHPDLAASGITSDPMTCEEAQPNGRKQHGCVIIGVVSKLVPRNANEAIEVAKRGGKRIENGPTDWLNFWIRDDTEELFCRIDRYDYEKLNAKDFTENSKVNKTLVAVKGEIPKNFRMLRVQRMKIMGVLDYSADVDEENEELADGTTDEFTQAEK